MGTLYGFAIGNTPDHLACIPSDTVRFPVAETQFEMWRSQRDGAGNDLIPGGEAPAQWLHNRNVDMWSYIYLQFTSADLGTSSKPPSDNQYYFRRDVKENVDANGWYCHCIDGSISDHFYGKMMPLALDDPDYRAWAVGRVLEELAYAGTKQLRFDVAFLQPESYIYCPITCGDSGFNRGLFAIFDQLREEGVKVVANGAWEMSNPDDAPDYWEYPAMAHVDGVMAEVPHGGKHASGGWWSLTDERVEQVARAWLDAGKAFIMAATYIPDEDEDRFGSFDAFAHHYYDLAQRIGCRVSINHREESGDHTPWLDWYPEEAPDPLIPETEPPEPETFDEMLTGLAEDAHCLDIYPDAALFKEMLLDAYYPTSNEFSFSWNGVDYVGQRAERTKMPLAPRVYYVKSNDWTHVEWIEIEK